MSRYIDRGDIALSVIYEYRNTGIYFHHSRDEVPLPEKFKMHAHEMMEIFCFISGNAQFLVEGNAYSLSAGDIMIMRPAETHMMQIQSDVPYERVAIHFSQAYIERICPGSSERLRAFADRGIGEGNLYRPKDFLSDHVKSCLLSMAKNCPLLNDPERYLFVNLLSVLEEIDMSFDVKSTLSKPSEPLDSEELSRKLVDYINRNLYKELSVKQLSEIFFISTAQLNRIFKRSTGSSVWEYILVKRLLEARRRIKSGEPASKVCYLCGFGDYSAFYRAYKSKFGASPKTDKS